MYSFHFSVEIISNLTTTDSQAQDFLDKIESVWENFLTCLGFELQFDRYSQGICDCDHALNREWCCLAVSMKRNCQQKTSIFHLFQIVQSYCELFQENTEIRYCVLKMK